MENKDDLYDRIGRFLNEIAWPMFSTFAGAAVIVLSQYPAMWLGYDRGAGPIVLGMLATMLVIANHPPKWARRSTDGKTE